MKKQPPANLKTVGLASADSVIIPDGHKGGLKQASLLRLCFNRQKHAGPVGPVVGILVGAVFGLFSLLYASNPIFSDPLVSIFPRLFIGLAAYLAFIVLKRISLYWAWIAAGFLGTLTNTVLVISMAFLKGYITLAAVTAIIPQFIAEAVIAIVSTIAIARGIDLYKSRKSWYADQDDIDV